jgi:hypothetical protein
MDLNTNGDLQATIFVKMAKFKEYKFVFGKPKKYTSIESHP